MTGTRTKPDPIAQARASGLRFVQVLDDHMTPTFGPRDYVLLAPTTRFAGEGYYLIANRYGDPASFHCDAAGTKAEPMIRLHCHNAHYAPQTITLASFEEQVLGKVAMICNVVAPSLLPDLRGAR